MRRVLVICCSVIAMGAAPAIAGGPEVFKASVKLGKSIDGVHCPLTESASWKNVPAPGVTEIEFNDFHGTHPVTLSSPATSGVTTMPTEVSIPDQFGFSVTFISNAATLTTVQSNSVFCRH